MKQTRRLHLPATALIAAALACGGSSYAQTYPAKTIRMIVPIAPGGSTDLVGRLVGQRLSEQMGVAIVTDNRAGAGSVIGTEALAKSAPDGYTMMTIAVEFTINPGLRKLPYDPIRDFTCVTQLTSSQYFLSTHPAIPVKDTKAFIALARSRPGEVNYASSGPGSANHLAGVLFQQMTNTKLVHVPYKSAGQAAIAVMSGEVAFMFSNVASVIEQVRAGKVRAIATTGLKRTPVAPEVPTVHESAVPGFIVTGFHLLIVPGATPPDIVSKLNAETLKALEFPAVRERLITLGLEPAGTSSPDCAKHIQKDIARWVPVVKAGGARAD
jgi:tripartite-type tricarboxylate transporter receptor subunit TctC